MGRTGKMFGIEHFGVEPDIVAVAKGVASGLPLGVTTARADVMTWPPGAHASTFGGNPVSCAAAMATITLLKDTLIKNSAEVGALLIDRLRELQQKHPIIGDVRGKGLMIGIELVRDRATKERATSERDRVVDACFSRGLLVLGAGRNAHPSLSAAGADKGAGRDGRGHHRPGTVGVMSVSPAAGDRVRCSRVSFPRAGDRTTARRAPSWSGLGSGTRLTGSSRHP